VGKRTGATTERMEVGAIYRISSWHIVKSARTFAGLDLGHRAPQARVLMGKARGNLRPTRGKLSLPFRLIGVVNLMHFEVVKG
jgi:hypothetical protein